MSLRSKLSTVAPNSMTADKYTDEVLKIANIVPIGIDFCASAKSPDLFEPAIIPEKYIRNKNNDNKQNVFLSTLS